MTRNPACGKKTTGARGAIFLAAVLLALVAQPVSTARADLLILPIRVVFKGHDRMQSLTAVNTANTSAIFRLALFYQKQTEDGSYVEQEQPLTPGVDIAKMIVFSPRQVSLPPGASQAVRLSLRRPPDLPDGEYRVHLRLQRLTNGQPLSPVKKNGVTTQVVINVGFAIPVIVRQGKYDAAAKISDLKFTPGTVDGKTPPSVQLYLDRSGKFSTLGHINVFWTPANGGGEKQVGILNDVNVFAELQRRKVTLNLSDNAVSGGSLRVTYDGDDADKGLHFDEKTFSL